MEIPRGRKGWGGAGGGGAQFKKPSIGGVWIFSGTTQSSSLQLIVTTNFTATIYCGDLTFCFVRYRCNEVWLERYILYLGKIARRLYRHLADLSFQCSPIRAMFR